MRNWKFGLMATVAVLGCFGVAESASAQAIYSGGATFPSKVYRQLFDCYYVQADGNGNASTPPLAISPACPSGTGDSSGIFAMILYAPVGSGAGKRALTHHDGSNSTTTGLGTPAAANVIPYVSSQLPAYGYPDFHFAGSDDTLLASDVATYNANSGPAKYGAIIEIPGLVGGVTVPFNGKDGNGNPLNIVNATPTGGSSGLNLSRQALCGLVSGHITKWNNPILTALNGGVALGSGNITFVHRSDGSGTNSIFTKAIVAQCASQFGPMNESNATLTLYEFPWTDKTAPAAQCPALPFVGSNQSNWPDQGTDQCTAVIANPGGGTFAQGSGNAGVAAAITNTNGAIGYVTPDFVAPIVTSGLSTANLQSQYDLDNGTGTFEPPTAAGALTAMSSATPVFDATTVTNPLNWSAQAVVANPVVQGSYPIAGFTFLDFYQCYAGNALTFIQSYMNFHYTDQNAKNILAANGFAPIPASWLSNASFLVNQSTVAMGTAGAGTCSAVGPGA